MRGNHTQSPGTLTSRLSEAGHRPYCAAHEARRHEALPAPHADASRVRCRLPKLRRRTPYGGAGPPSAQTPGPAAAGLHVRLAFLHQCGPPERDTIRRGELPDAPLTSRARCLCHACDANS